MDLLTNLGRRKQLVSLEGHNFNCTLRFDFKYSNNVAEYKAKLIGLGLVKESCLKRFQVYNDSQLLVRQINRNFNA